MLLALVITETPSSALLAPVLVLPMGAELRSTAQTAAGLALVVRAHRRLLRLKLRPTHSAIRRKSGV